MNLGVFGVEIPIAILSWALWRQLRTPGPVTKLACMVGMGSLVVGLLAWRLMPSAEAATVGMIPVGLFAILLIVAAARKERFV